MTTLPNMGLVLPTRGSAGSGHWADALDAQATLIDAHDHKTGKGLPINSAALAIDGDVSFNSLWAVTALKRATFASVAPPAVNKSIFVGDGTGGTTANELYWTSASGANVKITSGSSLNVAAFTGGIGGDYTAVSASVQYDDANTRYTFKQGGGTTWARLQSGPLRIAELGTSETVFVEQVAPAALGASYTMTWPTALPGSAQLAQIDNTGQWSFTNTLPSNQNITLAGTGAVKHGTYTLQISAASFAGNGYVATPFSSSSGTMGGTGAGFDVFASIPLPDGRRIRAIRVFAQDNITGPTKVTANFRSYVGAGAVTDIASSAASSGAGTLQTLTIGSLTTTIVSGSIYVVRLTTTSGSSSVAIQGAEVDYDFP
jgi:hypothetical protein